MRLLAHAWIIAIVSTTAIVSSAADNSANDKDASARSTEIRVPPRSRKVANNHYISRRTFRKTVVFMRKQLSRRGYAHREVPIYGYRGVTIARFIAEGAQSWNAVHVYRMKGKTYITVIPAKAVPTPKKKVDPPQSSE